MLAAFEQCLCFVITLTEMGGHLTALLLTLSRQGFFFIPLLFLLPPYIGLNGVWLSFPIADLLSTLVTIYFLNRSIRKELI